MELRGRARPQTPIAMRVEFQDREGADGTYFIGDTLPVVSGIL